VFSIADSVLTKKRVADLDPTKANSAEGKFSVQALATLAEVSEHCLGYINKIKVTGSL